VRIGVYYGFLGDWAEGVAIGAPSPTLTRWTGSPTRSERTDPHVGANHDHQPPTVSGRAARQPLRAVNGHRRETDVALEPSEHAAEGG
jgi:hypothetical protein